ncbi:MAG: hypothetical protein KDD42_05965, partial [Bdellovibrionales bacterium]|nr:hypothetical protein [Bdellovibrionales bacterium]
MTVNMRLKLKLYIGFYIDSSAERHAENLHCLQQNIKNPEIDEIWLFVSEPGDFLAFQQGKVKVAKSKEERCTYQDFIEHANSSGEHFLLMMANSDIKFDQTLSLVHECMNPGRLLCLTRRELQSNGCAPYTKHYYSSDAWIVEAPVRKFVSDVTLGKVHCESEFLGRAQRAGYELKNFSLSINAFHVHLSEKRNINPAVDKYEHKELHAFPFPGQIPPRSSLRPAASEPSFLFDPTAFAKGDVQGIRYWGRVLLEWVKSGFSSQIVLLDRLGQSKLLGGFRTVDGPQYNPALFTTEARLNQEFCDLVGVDAYVCSSESSALGTPTIGFV